MTKKKDATEIRLLTEKEAADILRRSTKTLQRLRQKGELPFVRLGHSVAYTSEILEKFLNDNTRNLAA